MTIYELDQLYEIPLTEYRRGPFGMRYAYARSRDCQLHNERGQDYLVWRVEPSRAAFALCDGVGSSFFGGIGAQVVGEALMEWLWTLPQKEDAEVSNPVLLSKSLQSQLNSRKDLATKLIKEKDLASVESEIARDALSTRRNKNGTQSNFVCGIVDVPSQDLPHGQVFLFWLGDAKLQIWKGFENKTNKLNATWDPHEAWSSNFGVAGDIHYYMGSLEDLNCIIAHSDGVDPISSRLSPKIATSDLEKGLNQLGDDDVSYLELNVFRLPDDMEDDLVSILRKSPQTPVRILKHIQTTKQPPKIIEKRMVPRRFYLLSIVTVFLTAIFSGLLGYIKGGIHPPIQEEPVPITISTNTPEIILKPRTSPQYTESPTSTLSVLPLQETPSGTFGSAEVFLTYEGSSVPLPLLTGCNELGLDGLPQNTIIAVNGAFRVSAFPTQSCQESPIVIFLDGAVQPVGKNILSVYIETIQNP